MANKVNVDLDMNVEGYVQGIDQVTQSTEKYETETRKVADAQVNLMKELKAAKKEVQNLAAGYAKLDAEARKSAFGKEMARQLEEAKAKAAEYIDLQGDLQAELKNMASDTHTLDMLSEGMGIFADVTAGALGVVAQFTGNEKDAQKAIVAFTTAQSILSGVTKIQNALQMQSNTMMAVTKVQALAAAAAERIKTAATAQGTVATKAATVAQALFNKVAMANPYVLLATAILGVVGALTAFISFTGKSAAEQEREQRIAERQEQVHKAYYDTLNSELDKTIPKYIQLQEQWKNLRTEGEKIEWIKDNKDAFNDLGVEIDNVNDAENFLETQTEAVMNSFLQRAKAIAVAQQAAEIYKQALEDIQWLEENRGSKNFKSDELSEHGFNTNNARIDHHGGALGTGHARYEITDYDAQIKQRQEAAEKAMRSLYQEMGRLEQQGEEGLTNAGVKAIKKGNKARANARKSGTKENKKVIHEGSLEEAEELVKTWETALKQADVNDTELVTRINKKLDDAKKEVARRKMVLGIDVKVNIVPGSSKDFDNQIKALREKQEGFALGSEDWRQLEDQIERLNNVKKLITEGVTVQGNTGLSKAFNEDLKTVQELENAISVLQNKLNSVDLSTLGEDGGKTFEQYIERIQELKAELEPLKENLEDAMLTPLEKAQKKMQQTANDINSVGQAVQAAGELFSALGEVADDDGLKVAGIVAKAVATVALSFAQALTTAKTWIDWLAFGVTGLATMVTMIGQIKSLTAGGYAQGGIVPGSSYSGDRLTARVNSGEMILNQRQQKNLFNMLDQGAMPSANGTNVTVTGVIRGTDLMLVQKNTSKVMKKRGASINF